MFKKIIVVLTAVFLAVLFPLASFADDVALWQLPSNDIRRYINSPSDGSYVNTDAYYADFSAFLLSPALEKSDNFPSEYLWQYFFTYYPLTDFDVECEYIFSSGSFSSGGDVYYQKVVFNYAASTRTCILTAYYYNDTVLQQKTYTFPEFTNQNIVFAGFRVQNNEDNSRVWVLPLFWQNESVISSAFPSLELSFSFPALSVVSQQHNYYLLGMGGAGINLTDQYTKLLNIAVGSPYFQSHLKDVYGGTSKDIVNDLNKTLDNIYKDNPAVTGSPGPVPTVPDIDYSTAEDLDGLFQDYSNYDYKGYVENAFSLTTYMNALLFCGRIMEAIFDAYDFLHPLFALIVVFTILNMIRGVTLSKIFDSPSSSRSKTSLNDND